MRFTYPARLRPDSTGELIVSFRDLPECLTSGASPAEALAEAADALEEAIAGRIDDAESIPIPSARRTGRTPRRRPRRHRGQGRARPCPRRQRSVPRGPRPTPRRR